MQHSGLNARPNPNPQIPKERLVENRSWHLLSNDLFSLCLLICAYLLLTDQLQSPYCSLTNLLQLLLTPLLSVFVILCFLHVYKAPGAHRSPGGIPPSIGQNYPSLSLFLSVSLYSLSLVDFSASLKASVSKFIQVYQVQVFSLGSDGV